MAPSIPKPEWTSKYDAQEKVRPQIETLEKNTENLAAVMSQMRDDFDALLPAVIDWEKTESKEELAQSLR